MITKRELDSLQGWCSLRKAEEFDKIIKFHKPKLLVEIGVFTGSSLIAQAVSLKENGEGHIHGIDPYCKDDALKGMKNEENIRWWSEINYWDIEKQCIGNIQKLDCEDYVTLHVMTAEKAACLFQDETIDLLNIDGNHGEAEVLSDVKIWLPKVKTGGFIFYDDVSWHEAGHLTTVLGLEFLKDNGCKIITTQEDWAVLQKTGINNETGKTNTFEENPIGVVKTLEFKPMEKVDKRSKAYRDQHK